MSRRQDRAATAWIRVAARSPAIHLPSASVSSDALPAAGRSWPAAAGRIRGPEIGLPHATTTEVAAMPDTNITEDHHRAFEALASARFDNICLVSCFLDGEAIAAMTLTDHNGREA